MLRLDPSLRSLTCLICGKSSTNVVRDKPVNRQRALGSGSLMNSGSLSISPASIGVIR
jgi:hypothetical protein